MNRGKPRYLDLYRTGELKRRAERLEARLASCDICPRACGIDRLRGETGFCHSGYLPIVASYCAHHGEEPVLSGSRGSGTIFFGNCNMRCIYCQNHQISQDDTLQRSNETSTRTLAERMLYLQEDLGCHNINLVSPSHFVPQIVRALNEAVPLGLKIPLVYNTGSYDSVATLWELEGIIDIYLADIRYADDSWSRRLSEAPGYPAAARAAIMEMQRQVGDLETGEDGIARRGLIIRHLIMPGGIAGSRESLSWLVNEVSPGVAVSIMSQYYPAHRARNYPPLDRKINRAEHDDVTRLVDELDIAEGWIQEMESSESYRPDFSHENPFPAETGG